MASVYTRHQIDDWDTFYQLAEPSNYVEMNHSNYVIMNICVYMYLCMYLFIRNFRKMFYLQVQWYRSPSRNCSLLSGEIKCRRTYAETYDSWPVSLVSPKFSRLKCIVNWSHVLRRVNAPVSRSVPFHFFAEKWRHKSDVIIAKISTRNITRLL
jgi:hypothetical protein